MDKLVAILLYVALEGFGFWVSARFGRSISHGRRINYHASFGIFNTLVIAAVIPFAQFSILTRELLLLPFMICVVLVCLSFYAEYVYRSFSNLAIVRNEDKVGISNAMANLLHIRTATPYFIFATCAYVAVPITVLLAFSRRFEDAVTMAATIAIFQFGLRGLLGTIAQLALWNQLRDAASGDDVRARNVVATLVGSVPLLYLMIVPLAVPSYRHALELILPSSLVAMPPWLLAAVPFAVVATIITLDSYLQSQNHRATNLDYSSERRRLIRKVLEGLHVEATDGAPNGELASVRAGISGDIDQLLDARPSLASYATWLRGQSQVGEQIAESRDGAAGHDKERQLATILADAFVGPYYSEKPLETWNLDYGQLKQLCEYESTVASYETASTSKAKAAAYFSQALKDEESTQDLAHQAASSAPDAPGKQKGIWGLVGTLTLLLTAAATFLDKLGPVLENLKGIIRG